MATGTAFSPANNITTTSANNFIPEIWSDEIIAAYKKNLVLANLVMKMNFKGKKGDTVHIPAPVRGSASAKGATNAVTLIVNTESEVQVSINKHYEYSRLIEDIVEAQALNSLRNFYTGDAGTLWLNKLILIWFNWVVPSMVQQLVLMTMQLLVHLLKPISVVTELLLTTAHLQMLLL